MKIVLKKVRVHNLKDVDLELDPYQLIVFSGVSGSGKSSLAFDTIYIEGQRRYIESLSTYARRHLGDFPKPPAELISGISPTLAVEQKTSGRSPRSTVGTMTHIHDFLRVLFARTAISHCPVSGEALSAQSVSQIIQMIQSMKEGTKIIILSPYIKGKKGEFKEDLAELLRKGFIRLRVDGAIVEISEKLEIDKQKPHDIDIVIDRLALPNPERVKEAVIQALEYGEGMMSIVNAESQEETFFSKQAHAFQSGLSYPPLEPHDFSFNHPLGMCPNCEGLGIARRFDLHQIINPELSISEDCCSIAPSYKTVRYGNIYDNLARLYQFKVTTPWKDLSKEAQDILLNGVSKKWIEMKFIHPQRKSNWVEYVHWSGILNEALNRYKAATSENYRKKMETLMEEGLCSSCHGSRLKPYPSAAKIQGKTILEITRFSIQEALGFFKSVQRTKVSEELLKEIIERLNFLLGVGLHYLSLDRLSPSLSGGEAQRVRLASHIGSGLVNTIYVLDEPSIGLHPIDSGRLLETLKKLRDKGNTVIVVEHDGETILNADYVVDIGPLAGEKGGQVLYTGDVKGLLECSDSLTGNYLSGKRTIPKSKKRKASPDCYLSLVKAAHHNLKDVTVQIPLGLFVAITGVSGSGKSSLISDTLYPALSNHLHRTNLCCGKHQALKGVDRLDKIIAIDQTPIGRSPRSNPATYIKLFDEIRDLFSQLPESQALGYKAGRFSFNVKEGSCPHCSGMGMIKIDMDFLEDEWAHCIHCEGKRFDEKTLSILYKGKNIHDILNLTVQQANELFQDIPSIYKKLETLIRVGLEYLKIGQPSPTLSGGEAQRIKLAKELSRPSSGKTFYILDEPTTGLHFHDIGKLVGILQSLTDKGNTVVVIEHNIDLIKTTDWVIELGPEGGPKGGIIVAEGSPELLAKGKTATGIALKDPLRIFSSPKLKPSIDCIRVEEASQNNLKEVSAQIPHGKITICTGPSGSGKSSFALETVFAEGQRRYVESMSSFARQFIKQMGKPKVERIEGLSPAIAIEQKNHAGNPRSTIGTMTESYDFLRILYAYLGTPHSPETGNPLETVTQESIVHHLLTLPEKTRIQILSPLSLKQEGFEELKARLQKQGYLRIRLNQIYYELDTPIPFEPHQKNTIFLVIDRCVIDSQQRSRLLEAIEQASRLSNGILYVDIGDQDLFFNLKFSDPETGQSYPSITPHTFSFNTDQGMCPDCLGLGFQYGIDLHRNRDLISQNPIQLLNSLWKETSSSQAVYLMENLLEKYGIDAHQPLKKWEDEQLHLFLKGPMQIEGFEWLGLNHVLGKAAKIHSQFREHFQHLLTQTLCLSCQGSRLNPLARNVRLNQLSIAEFCKLSIDDGLIFVSKLKVPPFLKEARLQLQHRLHFMQSIGLGYLSLDRSAPTLSGGETQRIRLSRQLGGGLTGCLYVLDEPTIGLHPKDNEKLNQSLLKLKEMGNTLLLVEHDPLTLQIADYILDFGPKAGREGGKIIARGALPEILHNPQSLTGLYLSGQKQIEYPLKRRKAKQFYSFKNCSLHNLKHFDLDLPLGLFTCITGVSGSGKSTLLHDIIKPIVEKDLLTSPFHKLIALDQNPLGQSSRSDITTYVDLLAPLRQLFAELPTSKAKGLQAKHFSYNHRKGMCTTCYGIGVKQVSLQFLPPVQLTCPACHGNRLNPLSLSVNFKGKHLGQILEMTVLEARQFLEGFPKIMRLLDTLISVGLDYLQLGQEIASLSGGEQQRIRLSRELSKRSSGKTLYLLDEPTIGLHYEDIVKLLAIFHQLVDKGHTVVLIEHNIDVIRNADYIFELGPGAGRHGGELIAEGTPEKIATNPKALMSRYLEFPVTV